MSVREFGNYLEEIVKDYLRVIKGYPLADTQYPYVFKHPIKHPHRPGRKLKDFPRQAILTLSGWQARN